MKKQKSIKSLFMSQRIIALSCLIFLFLFFSCFGKNFLTQNSMVSLLESVYYIICLAFGMTFVISTGGIDLSIGCVAMCGALIGGVSYNQWHIPSPLNTAISMWTVPAMPLTIWPKKGLP